MVPFLITQLTKHVKHNKIVNGLNTIEFAIRPLIIFYC